MLDPEEIKRRLDAARTLRGLKQTDLAELVHADGLGKHDVGRLERGSIPLTRALRDSLCRHLRVPEAWFTDPDLDLEDTGRSNSPATGDGSFLVSVIEKLQQELLRQGENYAALIVKQNELLSTQSEVLKEIRDEQAAMRSITSTQLDAARQMDASTGEADEARTRLLAAAEVASRVYEDAARRLESTRGTQAT